MKERLFSFFFFFFSSRRRHTRSYGDWSSDVCSSDLAGQLGEGHNDYWMTFGPTNVAIHDVEVLLERGDPAGALRRAAAVDIDVLPSLERRSTHYVHLAHAYVLRRAAAEATAALLQAERFNPEGLRYHMLARDLVRALLRRERRAAMPGLRGLAG